MPEQIGCGLANKVYPVNVVYEDDFICCILDTIRSGGGHTLILPKQHFLDADELDIEAAAANMNASILISKAFKTLFKLDGITVCQNGRHF